MEMKWKSLVGGGDRGPESKAKRRSLKMVRQPRKKAEGTRRWIEWRFKGVMMRRYKGWEQERDEPHHVLCWDSCCYVITITLRCNGYYPYLDEVVDFVTICFRSRSSTL